MSSEPRAVEVIDSTDVPNPYTLAYNRDRRTAGILNRRQGNAPVGTTHYGQRVI
jgi:hypothetical protein